MRNWSIAILLSLLLPWTHLEVIEAEPFITATTYLSDDDQLQGSVTWLMQDRKGYMWISTFNGLNRYDGYRWTRYKSDDRENSILHTNRINIFWENSLGDLWCNANGRMYLFDTDKEIFIEIQSRLDALSVKPANVTLVFSLPDGFSWLVGENGECFRVNDADPQNSCEMVALPLSGSRDLFKVFLDDAGQEWLLTAEGALIYGREHPVSKMPLRYVERCDSILWFTSANGFHTACYSYSTGQMTYKDFIPAHGYVYGQARYGQELYTATTVGIWHTDLSTCLSKCLSDRVCSLIFIDSKGRLWGETPDNRIVKLEDGVLSEISLPLGFSYTDNRIRFYEDGDGLVWLLPFDTNEILYFDGHSMVSPSSELQGQTRKGRGCLVDRQGNIWYHSNKRVDMLTIHNLPIEVEDCNPSCEVRSQLVDSQGNWWMGLREGRVVVRTLDGETCETAIEGTAYCIYEDSHHRIWAGSRSGGLYQLELQGGKCCVARHCKHDENVLHSLSSDDIYTMTEDSRGRFWIGTFSTGIDLFDPERDVFYHQGYHLAYDSELPKVVRLIREVRPGLIMVASREGFYTFRSDFDNPENIHVVHNGKRPFDATSIPDNDVMDIMVSRIDSSIWLSTSSGGICQIVSDDLLSDHVLCRSITKSDGLASDVCYSLLEDSNDNLWVTGGKSLSKIKHGRFGQHDTIIVYDNFSYPSPVLFSEGMPLNLGHEFVYGTMNGTLLFRPIELQDDGYVPPLVTNVEHPSDSRKDVSIRFSAIDFHRKSNLKYAYRMDKVDVDWKMTHDNSVTYVNLPSGNNHFHVRSTNADGVWTDNEQILDIYVQPVFLETFPGKLLVCFGVLMILLAILMVARRYYQLRHRLAVEKEMTDMRMRFFTDISHELRTPLTLVDGPVSEVLEDKTLSDQSRYYLEVVQKNVRRMLNLVNQILDARKIENRKMKLMLEHIELRQVAERTMENFQELAAQHHVNFVLESPSEGTNVWADRDKVEKILFNLLSNAFKYTDDGKRVMVNIAVKNQYVELSVADEGIGIKKEDIPNLFQRFDTILTSNVFKQSSGIGLSLVKNFAEMHHATVSVDSQVGKGSTFTVSFRKGRKHFENDANVEFYASDMVGQPASFSEDEQIQESSNKDSEEDSRATILLVEDNDELRDFMTHILEGAYRVVTATNGEEGLSRGKEVWPDLIVTDLMMPRMDGFEMIERIKADPDIYYLPIIVLTAKGSMDDRIKGVGMGIDDYVMKPFSASYLKARVAALIEQRKMLKTKYLEMLSQGNKGLQRDMIEPSMPEMTPADELFVQEAVAFMETNMDNAEISIDDFADSMKMGRTMFSNKLKAILGVTPIDFVQQMRIKRAVQLIKSEQYTIAEVAYKTGFNDPKYFSRCFKKHIGTSPSEYIKSKKSS